MNLQYFYLKLNETDYFYITSSKITDTTRYTKITEEQFWNYIEEDKNNYRFFIVFEDLKRNYYNGHIEELKRDLLIFKLGM